MKPYETKEFNLTAIHGGEVRVMVFLFQGAMTVLYHRDSVASYLSTHAVDLEEVKERGAFAYQHELPWITLAEVHGWSKAVDTEFSQWVALLQQLEPLVVRVGKRAPDGSTLRHLFGLLAVYHDKSGYYNLSSLWRSALTLFPDDTDSMSRKGPGPFLRRSRTKRLATLTGPVINSAPGAQMAPYEVAASYCTWLHPQLEHRILNHAR